MGERRDVEVWSASGAMALTGPGDGPPLGPPDRLVPTLSALAERIAVRSAALGTRLDLEPVAVLAERARFSGLTRRGRISCGGASRLLRTADGWMAVSLPRPDDWALLPAWLGIEVATGDWDEVVRAVRRVRASTVVAAGAELGLAVAELGEVGGGPEPVVSHRLGAAPTVGSLEDVTVVDLSSLWAGPLCGALLADAGARVIKVESTRRPDGARRGPSGFFDLLNAGKESVSVDFGADGGRRALLDLVHDADVVIEGSRPRALRQLGVDAAEAVGVRRPKVWLSITGHGRSPEAEHRVGFGDDAAVAGGLVSWRAGSPHFCADAVADPLVGLTAAATCLDLLATDGAWLVDLALSRIAAAAAGPTLDLPDAPSVPSPPPNRVRGTARLLGADNEGLLAGAVRG